MAHVGVGFQSIAPGGLQDAVNHTTGVGSSNGIGKQPVLPANGKRSDPVLRKIVVDGKLAVF